MFYKQKIPESVCVRKETVDIFVTSRNGDRKVMQSFKSNKYMSHENEELEPFELVQIIIYL